MSGTLGLSTPWARQGIDAVGQVEVEAQIPDGQTLGVSVSANRAWWLLWLVENGRPITSVLKVSTGLTLKEACSWALLTHWKVAS